MLWKEVVVIVDDDDEIYFNTVSVHQQCSSLEPVVYLNLITSLKISHKINFLQNYVKTTFTIHFVKHCRNYTCFKTAKSGLCLSVQWQAVPEDRNTILKTSFASFTFAFSTITTICWWVAGVRNELLVVILGVKARSAMFYFLHNRFKPLFGFITLSLSFPANLENSAKGSNFFFETLRRN